MIYNAKSVFLAVNLSLLWINNVSCLFLSSRYSKLAITLPISKLNLLTFGRITHAASDPRQVVDYSDVDFGVGPEFF
jgi:hypothetical protein